MILTISRTNFETWLREIPDDLERASRFYWLQLDNTELPRQAIPGPGDCDSAMIVFHIDKTYAIPGMSMWKASEGGELVQVFPWRVTLYLYTFRGDTVQVTIRWDK